MMEMGRPARHKRKPGQKYPKAAMHKGQKALDSNPVEYARMPKQDANAKHWFERLAAKHRVNPSKNRTRNAP